MPQKAAPGLAGKRADPPGKGCAEPSRRRLCRAAPENATWKRSGKGYNNTNLVYDCPRLKSRKIPAGFLSSPPPQSLPLRGRESSAVPHPKAFPSRGRWHAACYARRMTDEVSSPPPRRERSPDRSSRSCRCIADGTRASCPKAFPSRGRWHAACYARRMTDEVSSPRVGSDPLIAPPVRVAASATG